MKKGKEKKQPKQPLTPNKAFKAVLPVLVCIVLFIVIGITLVIIGNNKGNNPKVQVLMIHTYNLVTIVLLEKKCMKL